MEKLWRFKFENEKGEKTYDIFTDEELDGQIMFLRCHAKNLEDGFKISGVREYIGVNDLNDDLMFESDIVEFINNMNGEMVEGKIVKDGDKFFIQTDKFRVANIKGLENLVIKEMN